MNEYIERKLFPQKLCEAAWGRKKTFESLATNRTSAVRTEYCLLQNIADLISLRGAFHMCPKYFAQLSVVQWCSIWPPNRNWVKFQILTSNSSICLWIKIATTVSIFLNTCSLSHSFQVGSLGRAGVAAIKIVMWVNSFAQENVWIKNAMAALENQGSVTSLSAMVSGFLSF